MKIENVEVMVLKLIDKLDKENKPYKMVSMAVIEGGDVFDLVVKDLSLVKGMEAFQKAVVNLELTSSKYGLMLKII